MNNFRNLCMLCYFLGIVSCSESVRCTITKDGRPVSAAKAVLVVTEGQDTKRIERETDASGVVSFEYNRDEGDSLFQLFVENVAGGESMIASGGIKGMSVIGKWEAESYNVRVVVH
ncbi:MAG: hypothetical protein WCK77_23365 [Verrucomicrobiota bacterium]